MANICTCGLAMRMNSTVAAKAIAELSKHDRNAAEKIIAEANATTHKDWCGSATKWLKDRRTPAKENKDG